MYTQGEDASHCNNQAVYVLNSSLLDHGMYGITQAPCSLSDAIHDQASAQCLRVASLIACQACPLQRGDCNQAQIVLCGAHFTGIVDMCRQS